MLEEIRKKQIWTQQQSTEMKGCTIFKIHFNISDPTPRSILDVHLTEMSPKIADELSKLLETLATSFGGWESFGTDLQLVVSTIWQISTITKNAISQNPEDLQLLKIGCRF